MKTLKNYALLLVFLSSAWLANAQEEKNYQAYWVHEDRVKPSMTDTYEQISKDLVAACKEHKVQETKWLTMRTNDNSYIYVSPINSMADLDKNGFESLSEKMGEDKVSALFNRFNETYDEHGDYIIWLNKELSYMPDGISQTVEGENYRTFYYHYVTPEANKAYIEELKKVKSAFEKHNSKVHYRVYKSGFGVMGDYYMIAVSGENEAKSAQRGDENWEMMKDDFEPLMKEINKHIYKFEQKRGWMRPGLAYSTEE
jgi:hypothetical protein